MKLTDADRAQWRNIWCILRSLDAHELAALGSGARRSGGWTQ